MTNKIKRTFKYAGGSLANKYNKKPTR